MGILSVFNRMSPTSQKYRSTCCMRVVSSRSLTSAYTGAVSCWGVGALQPPRGSWARFLHGEGDAVGVGVVPILGSFAGALKIVRAADAQRA